MRSDEAVETLPLCLKGAHIYSSNKVIGRRRDSVVKEAGERGFISRTGGHTFELCLGYRNGMCSERIWSFVYAISHLMCRDIRILYTGPGREWT